MFGFILFFALTSCSFITKEERSDLNEAILWKLARLSVSRVLRTEHRGFLYNFLVFLQCIRYLCRFTIVRLLSTSPRLHAIVRNLKRKVAFKAANETKMISLVRDMGVHPKSLGPLDELKSHAIFEMIIDIIATDDVIDKHALEMLSQKLTQSGYGSLQDHWVIGKIKEMARTLPPSLFAEGFYAKVIRTMVGVVSYCLYKNRSYPLEKALTLGFHFGVLYLYDEVQDIPDVVSETEKRWIEKRVAVMLYGSKPNADEPPGSVSRYIHEAASELERLCPRNEYQDFYTCLRVLAQAQQLEITDTGKNVEYTYTLLALKSAMTRLIPASLAQWDITTEYVSYTMVTGIANQLIDDFRDFPEDYKRNTQTPFVRYYRNQAGSPHPFSVYLRAIEASIHFLPRHRFLARILWSIRLTHGMRVLALKSKQNASPLPVGHIWKHYVTVAGWCHHEIVDIEAILAQLATRIVSLTDQCESAGMISH